MSPTLTASATLDEGGRGSLTIGNLTRVIDEPTEAGARSAIMRAVLAHAQENGSPVVLDALDRAGHSKVIVHPDGRAEEVQEQPIAAQTAVMPALRLQTAPRWDDSPSDPSAAPQSPPGARTWRLRFSNGDEVYIWGTGLIGREPRIAGEQPTHLVTVDDPTETVSRVHLAFGQNEGRLWVQDLGSTNGTTIHRGTERVDCEGRRAYPLVPGSIVEMGKLYFLVSL